MASTVSNGNDRSEKWHRPFQMATTVYEREICGGEHVENQTDQNALELQFQQLQRQGQELLDRESPQDGLLSATQLTQVQSIVQGSLNEPIEKAASAAAQAAVSAFNGSSPSATVPPTQARDSSGNDALQISSPGERVPRALYFGLLHKYCHSFLSYRLLPN